ncbi:MAG: relA [Gammaproteobacteria bacterium]|jgi:GTP pyrophosphokinase|nr:relA [Gammaproteobacteria bacterium]
MKKYTIAVDNATGQIDLGAWLKKLPTRYTTDENSLIRHAASLAQLTGDNVPTPTFISCLQQGLFMGEILVELNVDEEALAAGILYSCVRYADLSLEDICEQLSQPIAKLIHGAEKMDAIDILATSTSNIFSKSKMDNIRKMLLAMVDDIRIVLLKLAEHLVILRHIYLLPEEAQKREASITHSIYAPLANRLGIGHIKWELEDFSFRYLEPEIYKKISRELKATRKDRETYVQDMIHFLDETMRTQLHIDKVEVTGRAKHIYSIYKKMTRKKVGLQDIYDALAFRILLPKVEDCYAALGQVHSLWQPIEKEFDDYVTTPKPNGYRSIHTAVVGPEDKHVEIQIRTFDMHEEAELGVAAHWIYKEGQPVKRGYEAKIAWLRQVMDWQQEVTQADDKASEQASQVFDDHIYVFTPQGDVVELPKGATPLDFAYHIHTNVGHRCRGAKINDQIVPLSYELKMGDRVSILTAKEGQPSRDWLNPHTGYLKTARAKSKVHQWLRQQDLEKNQQLGETLFDKELRRLGIKNFDVKSLIKKMHYQKSEDFFAALGRGDMTLSAIVHAIEELLAPKTKAEQPLDILKAPSKQIAPTDISIEGVGNLLTSTALCCKPIPGDDIIGYITRDKGISIHKVNCSNILNTREHNKVKLINVSWGNGVENKYVADLVVNAYERQGLVRDVTHLLVGERINLLGLTTLVNKSDNTTCINLSIEIQGLDSLSRILARLQQVPNVYEVKRV